MVLFSVTLSHKGDKKLNKSNNTMQTYAMILMLNEEPHVVFR